MVPEKRIAAYAARMGWPIERAREDAERLIRNAVANALRGDLRFDLLPRELEEIARQRWQARINSGDGGDDVVFVSGTTGLPLRSQP